VINRFVNKPSYNKPTSRVKYHLWPISKQKAPLNEQGFYIN